MLSDAATAHFISETFNVVLCGGLLCSLLFAVIGCLFEVPELFALMDCLNRSECGCWEIFVSGLGLNNEWGPNMKNHT